MQGTALTTTPPRKCATDRLRVSAETRSEVGQASEVGLDCSKSQASAAQSATTANTPTVDAARTKL